MILQVMQPNQQHNRKDNAMGSRLGQGPNHQTSLLKGKEKDVTKKIHIQLHNH